MTEMAFGILGAGLFRAEHLEAPALGQGLPALTGGVVDPVDPTSRSDVAKLVGGGQNGQAVPEQGVIVRQSGVILLVLLVLHEKIAPLVTIWGADTPQVSGSLGERTG